MSRPLLGCTMGDPAGIGPEILLRAADELSGATCVFLGDPATFDDAAGRAATAVPTVVESLAAARELSAPGPCVLPCAPVRPDLRPGRPRPEDGAAALASLRVGADAAAAGEIDALVTAPLSKHSVAQHEPGFRGHTEYLAARDGVAHPIMLFAAPRNDGTSEPDIALLTTHLPLATAMALVRAPLVEATLRRLHAAWGARFGRDPVIGLAALNPHAGEQGRIGGEEPRVLAPALAAVRADDIDARGPYPADSIFFHDELDVILALYHDQGTIMAKRAPWPTVNLTLGLSYVRTSPDHGTAYDLAGTGRADHRPMLAAMKLAAKLGGGG